jgi:hypothetical protein
VIHEVAADVDDSTSSSADNSACWSSADGREGGHELVGEGS